jgi:tape measure domain-containing protein
MSTSVLASMAVVLNGEISGFRKAMAQARKEMRDVVKVGESMKDVGKSLSMGLSLPLAALGGVGLKLASEMEQAKVAFTTMTGSAEQAGKTLGELKDFAASTPFEFPELQDAAKKLLAFGVSTDDLTGSLRKIGDISAGIGAPIGEIAEIFGKAKVQGRLFGEDINQLLGRGIPVIQEFAKQLGVSEGEVKKLVSEGKIGFPNLEQAFTDLTKEGGKFGGLMEAQSKTLGGLFSTLSDNVSMSLADMGTDLADALNIKGVMASVTEAVQYMANAFRGLSPETKKIIFIVGALVAAIGPLLLVIGSILTALPMLSAAFTVLAGPIGLTIAAIVAGVALIIANWDTLKAYFTSGDGAEVFQKVKEVAVKAFAMISAVISRFVTWGKAIWETFGSFILGDTQNRWGNITGIISGALDILGGVFDVFTNLWEGNWSGLWESVLKLAKIALGGLIDLVAGALTALPRMLAATLKGLGIDNAITRNLDKALNGVKSFVSTVKNDFLGLGETISTTFEITAPKRDAAATPTTPGGPTLPKDPSGELSKTQELLKKLREEFNLATAQFAVFGEGFDVVGAKSKALESTINSLLANGIKPQSALIQGLKAQLDGFNNASLDKLSNTFEQFADRAGTALDGFKEKVKGVAIITSDAVSRLSDSLVVGIDVAAMVAQAAMDTLDTLGQSIGQAIAGQAGAFDGFFTSIMGIVADFMGSFGRALMSAGVAALAFQQLLLNPAAAIAAGAALIVASGVVKGLLKKGPSATGASGGGSYSPPTPNYNSSASQTGPNELKFRIEGPDLVAIVDKANYKTQRLRG